MQWSIHILLMVILFGVMPKISHSKISEYSKKDCRINDFQIIF